MRIFTRKTKWYQHRTLKIDVLNDLSKVNTLCIGQKYGYLLPATSSNTVHLVVSIRSRRQKRVSIYRHRERWEKKSGDISRAIYFDPDAPPSRGLLPQSYKHHIGFPKPSGCWRRTTRTPAVRNANGFSSKRFREICEADQVRMVKSRPGCPIPLKTSFCVLIGKHNIVHLQPIRFGRLSITARRP